MELSDWKGNMTYYVRAYAKNMEDSIAYGEVKRLETPAIFTTSLAVFPGTPRWEGSAAYFQIGNQLYIVGGDLGNGYTDEMYSYNVVEDKWMPGYPYPSVVKGQTAVVYFSEAYVLGGYGILSDGQQGVTNAFYRYNSISNRWSLQPPGSGAAPDSGYHHAGFTLGSNPGYIGGRKEYAMSDVWLYSIGSSTWSRQTDFPVEQYGGFAASLGDSVIIAGLGKNSEDVCNRQLWRSSVQADVTLGEWVLEPELPFDTIEGGILGGVVHRDCLYLIDESHYIYQYRLSDRSWHRKSRLESAYRNVHCIYSQGDWIYIGLGSNTLLRYNPMWDN
jgi:N-acetylneuraminic acid mutarotase